MGILRVFCTHYTISRHRFVHFAANDAILNTAMVISRPQDQTFPFCVDQGSTLMCNTSFKVFGSHLSRQKDFHAAGFSARTKIN